MVGNPVLLLNTVGRKTGKGRTTPLLYLPDGDSTVIVASNGGAARHPAWWLNLREMDEATVEVDGREVRVRAEEVGGEEKRRLWTRLVEAYPGYASYQKKTEREIPVVRLRPVEGLEFTTSEREERA
jgi:deazaflavin-dependent oxidoreductase (nitroreductase family)